MTAKQLQKVLTYNPSLTEGGVSANYVAKQLARKCGLPMVVKDGRALVECSDCIAEVYWLNRKHTAAGVREAAC